MSVFARLSSPPPPPHLRWDELAPLATLGLQSLIVSNNSIVSIAVQEGEWAQLECISLDNNQVIALELSEITGCFFIILYRAGH